MNDTYKTMKGVPIDMSKLRMQNEKIVAVGNMKVNAKGDLVAKGGKVVKTSQQRVKEERKVNNIINNKSLKKDLTEDDMNVLSGGEKKVPVTPAPAPTSNKKKKTKEKELPDGSIEIVDEDDLK